MPAPEISSTSSILDYLQGEPFSFQPGATNFPTSWASSELPPGMTLDAETGLLEGPITEPGTYVVELYASNADGTAKAEFTFGVEVAAASEGLDVDLEFDVISRAVTLASGVPLLDGASTGAKAGNDAAPAPLFMLALGDDLTLSVRVVKAGTTVQTAVNTAVLELYSDSVEAAVLTSTVAVSESGTGVALRHRIYVKAEAENLTSAVDAATGAKQSRAKLFGLLTLTFANSGLGGSSKTLTSDAFGVEVIL